jgi:hypothetical protein
MLEYSNTFHEELLREKLLIMNVFISIYDFLCYNKYVTFTIIAFCLLLFIIFSLIMSYVIIKILEISLDKIVFFYDFNKLSKKVLKKYENCEINKIYLVSEPINVLLVNVMTLFKYQEMIDVSSDNFLYHTAMIVEVKLNDGKIKWLLLEKNNCVSINDKFIITKKMEVEEIKINRKEKMSLNDLLNETKNRMGNEQFFNWNVTKNNCQEFIKELLITCESYDDHYKEFIFTNELIKILHPSEFMYHMLNCGCIILNIIEKYTFEINLFE